MITRPISTEKQNFFKIFLESLMNEKSPPKKKKSWFGQDLNSGTDDWNSSAPISIRNGPWLQNMTTKY
jgi:hypothetical protein